MSDELKIGDELAFRTGFRTWTIHPITKISPTGRITAGPYKVRKNLTVIDAGAYSYARIAKRVTDEIRDDIEKQMIADKFRRIDYRMLSLDVLRKIDSALKDATECEVQP